MIMINNKKQDYNNDNMPIRRDHEDALRGRRFSTVAPLRCKITITPKARCFYPCSYAHFTRTQICQMLVSAAWIVHGSCHHSSDVSIL